MAIYVGSDGQMIITTGAMIVVSDRRKRRVASRKQWPVADHTYIREAP